MATATKPQMLKRTRITAKWARRMKACPGQVAIFEKEWPDGANITAANIRRALKLGLEWMLKHMLTAVAAERYEHARYQANSDYQDATGLSRDKWYAATTNAAIDRTYQEHKAQQDKACRKYERAMDQWAIDNLPEGE